jgi:tryptophanase
VSNGVFDTTKSNLMQCGFKYKEFPLPLDPTDLDDLNYNHSAFKGDIDLDALRAYLKENVQTTTFVMLTLTNNMYGGLPVSLRCLRETRVICDEYDLPLWIDGCRVNENAYFI